MALSVKRYTFPNDYTRSMKVNTAVELLVQETFQLCSAMHSSVILLLLLSENWSSQQLNTSYISAWSEDHMASRRASYIEGTSTLQMLHVRENILSFHQLRSD